MKLILKILSCLIIALIIGGGSALWISTRTAEHFWTQYGPWRYNPEIGAEQTGMYSRAAVARSGLFALNKSEAVYFITSVDDQGRPLSSDYDYRVEGVDLPARWWSITLYGDDFFLIPNPENRYSYNMNNVPRQPDGSYVIRISPTERTGAWLPTGDRTGFCLTLRLYNPSSAVLLNPERVFLPRITREERS